MTGFVDFFVIGAMKSGTSSLCGTLRRHPNIRMPKQEIRFFEDLSSNHSHFDSLDGSCLIGEKTPTYAPSRAAPERLRAYNPDARLIYLVRHPVKRAVSQYRHTQRRSEGKATALEAEIRYGKWDVEFPDDYLQAYVHRSRYDVHIERWLEFFPRDQIQVVLFEDLVRDPTGSLERIQELLGQEPVCLEFRHNNPTKSEFKEAYPVAPETKQRLQQVLDPTVDAMERFLGRDLPEWRVPA